jgi:diaminopimelate decarboxylase
MQKDVNQEIMPSTAKINALDHLEIGGCDITEVAKQYGTPIYVFDEETIRKSCREYKEAFAKYENVHMLFASKAFMTKAICCIMKNEGFGLDVVSGGEIYTAHKAGFPLKKAFFNGNNKSAEELELALKVGIGRITVDNFYELELLNNIAVAKGKNVNILLRITPGIECHTHEYIQTGHLDSKFGFDLTQLGNAIELIKNKYTSLTLKGLHGHIGSQIFEKVIYNDLVEIILGQFQKIQKEFGIELEEMNIGGGLGITYTQEDTPPSKAELAEVVLNAVEKYCAKYAVKKPKLIIEPGRSLVGTAGVTVYKAGSYKQVPKGRKYIAVDGGMADNPRPAMYGAIYHAIIANKANEKPFEKVTIAGKYCESGDVIIKDIELPKIEPGDLICVFNTGAYNYSMSSNYNRVAKPATILLHKGKSDVIIKRETFEDLTALDLIPQRLSC